MLVELGPSPRCSPATLRVLRRQVGQFVVRTVMQPLLFVFVFAYVFPKIGQGFRGAADRRARSRPCSCPGLIAVAINFQGIQAVALPLVQEFSYSKEIEDRVLAPVPVWMVGFEKIFAGASSRCSRRSVVFPIVYLVHAQGRGADGARPRLAALPRRRSSSPRSSARRWASSSAP